MALDARTRSSIYGELAPILGDEDANALVSQFPSSEHDGLVTKQFLRAALSELRSEFREELAELRGDVAGLRVDGERRLHQLTLSFGGALTTATALIIGAMPLLT